MKKKSRKILRSALAMAVSLSMVSGVVFAAEYDLTQGSVVINSAAEGGQTVQHGEHAAVHDAAPVINGHSTETANTITVKGNQQANLTIQDVVIQNDAGDGIDIQGTTTANIEATGTNSVTTSDQYSAAIHVSEGTLNLNTAAGSTVSAENSYGGNGSGAAIGSHGSENAAGKEDMSGAIHLTGSGSVNAYSTSGAAIGSGEYGEMSGSITTGDGEVTAESCYGAAIGSGYSYEIENSMSGSITTGKGKVTAESEYGAAIGSGGYSQMSGSITTGDGEIDAYSDEGAAIGSGCYSQMSGSITTGDGEVTAESCCGAAIGSGYTFGIENSMSGSITTGKGKVTAKSEGGAAIGSGEYGEMSGSITTGKGEVTANSEFAAAIGSGEYSEMSGSIAVGKGKVTAESEGGAGIGSGWGGDVSGAITVHKDGPVSASSQEGNAVGHGVTFVNGDGSFSGLVKDDAKLRIELGSTVNGTVIRSKEDAAALFPDYSLSQISVFPPSQSSGSSRQLYWVTSHGAVIQADLKLSEDTLTVAADCEDAELHITAAGMQSLKSQGIQTVIFRTTSAESKLDTQKVLSAMGSAELVIQHEGSVRTLTVGGAEKPQLLS